MSDPVQEAYNMMADRRASPKRGTIMNRRLGYQLIELEIAAAYIRGANWQLRNMESSEYLSKAAHDYADKTVSEILKADDSQPVTERVLALFDRGSRWTVTEIKAALPLETPKRISNALARLVRRGCVRKAGYGEYCALPAHLEPGPHPKMPRPPLR